MSDWSGRMLGKVLQTGLVCWSRYLTTGRGNLLYDKCL